MLRPALIIVIPSICVVIGLVLFQLDREKNDNEDRHSPLTAGLSPKDPCPTIEIAGKDRSVNQEERRHSEIIAAAHCQIDRFDFQAAKDLLNLAISQGGETWAYRLLLADILKKSGQFEGALRIYHWGLVHRPEAEKKPIQESIREIESQLQELAPDSRSAVNVDGGEDTELPTLLVTIDLEEENFLEAKKRLLTQSAGDQEMTIEQVFLWFDLKKRYDDAIVFFSDLIGDLDQKAIGYFVLAKSLLWAGREREGLSKLLLAIKARPESWTIVGYVTEWFTHNGVDRGLAFLSDEVIPLVGRKESCLNAAAHLYLNDERVEQAIPLLDEVIRKDKENVQALWLMAKVHIFKKKFANAVPLLYHVLEIDESHHLPYYLLAESLVQLRRSDEACAVFQKAIDLLPKDGWAYVERATCLKKLGQTDKAEELLRKAIQLADDPLREIVNNSRSEYWLYKAYHVLFDIYRSQGRNEGMRTLYE